MTVQLKTKRLKLRSFDKNDLTQFISIATEPDIAVLPTPDAATQVVAECWIDHARISMQSGTAYKFALIEKTSDIIIGMSGLTSVHQKHLIGKLGFWIGSAHRGQGYAIEACQAVVHFAFDQLKLIRLTAATENDNLDAASVLKKLGFFPTVGLRRKLQRPIVDDNVTLWELTSP